MKLPMYACVIGEKIGKNYAITNILFTNDSNPWPGKNNWVRYQWQNDSEHHKSGFIHLLTYGVPADGQGLRYGTGYRWTNKDGGTLTGRLK